MGKVGESLRARADHNEVRSLWYPEGDPGLSSSSLIWGYTTMCTVHTMPVTSWGHSSSYFFHKFNITELHKVRMQCERCYKPTLDLMISTFILQSFLAQYSNSQRYISLFVWNYCSFFHILISNFHTLSWIRRILNYQERRTSLRNVLKGHFGRDSFA